MIEFDSRQQTLVEGRMVQSGCKKCSVKSKCHNFGVFLTGKTRVNSTFSTYHHLLIYSKLKEASLPASKIMLEWCETLNFVKKNVTN